MKVKLSRVMGVFASVGLFCSTTAAYAQQAFNVTWDNGLNYAVADGLVQGKIGARIFHDIYFALSADKALENKFGRLEDGTEFRDLLLWTKGSINDNFEYSYEQDFSNGNANLEGLWVGFKDLPWGGLRAGHMNEPFGFEQIMDSGFIAHMERGLPVALVPGRNTGLMAYGSLAQKVVGWQAGIFYEDDATGSETSKDDSLNYTARLFADPLFESDGERVIHAGIVYSRKQLESDIQFKSDAEAHLGPIYVDTGKLAADSTDLYGGEFLGIFGPVSVQSEYIWAAVNTSSGLSFSGVYGLASFFITGEHKNYQLGSGTIGAQKVLSPLIGGNGAGAWELTSRVSYLDLNDKSLRGGELADFTAGINWYLCTNARIMLNYVYADPKEFGKSHILENRFQVYF